MLKGKNTLFSTSMLVPSLEFQTNQSIQFIAGMIYRAPVIWGIIYFINNYVWIPIKPPVFQCFMENKAIFFVAQMCSVTKEGMMKEMERLCLIMALVGVANIVAATLQGACFKTFSERQLGNFWLLGSGFLCHKN